MFHKLLNDLKLQKIKIFYLQYASSHRLIGYFIALQSFRLEINWFELKIFFTFDSENIPLHQEPFYLYPKLKK